MTTRAALYARFSSDLQNVGSIADQLEACRRHAARLGAAVVATYEDAAISGAAAGNRPGLQALLAAARAGAFDVVIAEALDRLTRSGGDAWDIYEDLRSCGVAINTLAEGEAQTLHIGLKGTMNALFLEELARKTRRGQAGVARQGRHAGGRVYGYRRLVRLDPAGQPIPGLLEIHEGEAAIVRRILAEYADGASSRTIAARLNAEGIPGPRGGLWNASTIHGNPERGNGLLHNELYAGTLVWGRHSWTKDRRTGRRRARAGDAASIERVPVPHLRIVDAALWARVRDRHAALRRATGTGAEARPDRARRPRRLLSGLVRCGSCGGPMTHAGPDARLLCATRKEKGPTACDNGRTARAADVEDRVLAAVRDNLLHPAVIEAAVREYRAAMAQRQAGDGRRRAAAERELAEVRRRAARLVDQVADGHLTGAAVAERLAELEARRAELERQLAEAPAAQVVTLHPAAAGRYRQLVDQLRAALGSAAEAGPERENAREALRQVITAVRVIPAEGRGRYEIEIEGNLAPLAQANQDEGVRLTVGAGTRSGRCPNIPVRLRA